MRFVCYNHSIFREDCVVIKYILLVCILGSLAFANVIKTPVLSVDKGENTAIIQIKHIDVGVSGFIVQRLSNNDASILMNAEVISYDLQTQMAVLQLEEFNQLAQNSLPSGNWKVKTGDIAVLAFGYTRALLIAPNQNVYTRVTKKIDTIQWVHPDLFATLLSMNGHPSPLKEDFNKMSVVTSTGLVLIYLNQKLFTVDAKSMKILNISKASMLRKKAEVPFFTRVNKIESNWWGKGSSKIKSYDSYYYELLLQSNPKHKGLQAMHARFLKEQ